MSEAGRICPQCGYQRQPRDLAPAYECPRCGIIYDKYVPPKPPGPAAANGPGERSAPAPPSDPAKPAEDRSATPVSPGVGSGQGLVPASMARRAWAAIYTQSKVFYYTTLFMVPVYYVVWIICYGLGVNFSSQFDMVVGLVGIFVLGLAINAYLLYPIRHGETWGQKEFGLTVYPGDNPRGDLKWTHWYLRGMGNGFAVMFFWIPLVGFLYGLYVRKDFLGFADRFSMTRQYETGKPSILRFRYALSRAFKPYAMGLLIAFFMIAVPSLIVGIYSHNLETRRAARVVKVVFPEEVEKQRAYREELKNRMAERADAQAVPMAFKILTDFEQRHHSDHGSYTTDLEALVSRYAAAKSNAANSLRPQILDGSIRARLTDQGVEIWAQDSQGNWQSKEIRR